MSTLLVAMHKLPIIFPFLEMAAKGQPCIARKLHISPQWNQPIMTEVVDSTISPFNSA